MKSYEPIPFKVDQRRADVISRMLREIMKHETIFSDYAAECLKASEDSENPCTDLPLEDMCQACQERMARVSRSLSEPHARVFEIWEHAEEPSGSSLVGVVYFVDVNPGVDATGHYVFFDRDLQSKTGVLKDVMRWVFSEEDLQRLTVEIPDHAFILARHAQKRLGFGGPFTHELGGKKVSVEGVKRGAVKWRGEERDLLIMGITREEFVEAAGSAPASAPREPALAGS